MAISVLIPDGESHLLIYVINTLSQAKEVNIYVMSNIRHIPVRYSRRIQNFSYFPKTNDELVWINNVKEESERHNIDLILPIFEDAIETLSKYKNEIIFKDKLCLLPNNVDYNKANNKWSLAEHLLVNNMSFPRSALYSKLNPDAFKHFRFPVIIKPILKSGGGVGVCLFNNNEELQIYLLDNNFDKERIIQEYVNGYDIGCSVLCQSGSILAFTIQKATMVNSNPFEPLLGVEFVYDDALFELVNKLMMSLNWSGVAHIDLRFDVDNNIYKVIEVNTRFWGSLEASMIAGVNFPYLHCLASLNKNFERPEYNLVKYLNLKGLVKSMLKNIALFLNFKFIMNNTPVRFALKDPLPTILKYMFFAKNIFMSKLKNKLKLRVNSMR
ncbi:ATP-grasp domain-containing protein [Mariniflexile sp. AS56]|uniref:ATP-grasp domain-containing protein n=1 Tax=Mariniflexile sp. AS56 TaxID=3063957 RepID=UPI0026EE309A|nr:ATP-grasp domain-containing protein [Mariniflexile sp. AS56]MDO7171687.1 ATP-grasp domain-containing protein [Mariniflexile sp. AS56]